ncbi:putative U2 small nuclear ribonucleoprotein B [Gregarina niphandrodes]|uniref:U2 small nuclear ribonucleoprotein B n=1 Tax=Gregarina niphandrodes TaxID=110365 RepID=A0A023B936_GRENI|nr:putative U2 small nuclear ribonucleoprotein B [Gregarina niphandrodes]EZG70832.1 putative U2 small nuclear ribonucleoprotein B [Gregarina niphandrodes]|eukprot:XP_011129866.1 putative U2 small nuclear ribonucleoprotein B [Gregarina niphandrodes]
MSRMMGLVMKLTRPEKNIQQNKQVELLPPSRTIYVNNLNEKTNPIKLEEDLRALFSKFGDIVDFSALRSFWRRGQAFISFKDLESAERAVTDMQGYLYSGKPMRVNFARKESWVHDDKRKEEVSTGRQQQAASSDPSSRKPFGIQERERALQQEFLQLQQDLIEYQRSLAASAEERGKRKSFSLSLAKPNEKRAKIDAPTVGAEPHRILFCDSVPDGMEEGDLIALFANFAGFEKVRYIEAKKVAFVDFRTVDNASTALQSISKSGENKGVHVTYAKR